MQLNKRIRLRRCVPLKKSRSFAFDWQLLRFTSARLKTGLKAGYQRGRTGLLRKNSAYTKLVKKCKKLLVKFFTMRQVFTRSEQKSVS